MIFHFSNCSGSDTMQSPTGSSGEVEEVDLSGLMESVVDSDEDEEEEECDETSLLVRDAVRECLEKDPSDRGKKKKTFHSIVVFVSQLL